MGRPHLSPEQLSALADGECLPDEARAYNEHLFSCGECRSSFQWFAALDTDLKRAPLVACEAALPLISARLDGEIDAAEAAVADRHLEACAACQATRAAWSALPAAFAALPAGAPSERVDRVVRELAQGQRRRNVGMVVLNRALITVTAVLLIVVGSLSRTAAPIGLEPPDQNTVLVAAAQQVVLDPATNSLYVLDPAGAAVDVRDASTSELKARIALGGKPTALALNATTNTVYVLDASQKTVTEIDAKSVISSSAVPASGTPTSISVDPAGAKIVVTSSATTTDTSGASGGALIVLDGATKAVQAVHDVSVAPSSMVFDAVGGRALVVSPKDTTILDQNYKVIATLPGGIAGAFARGSDRVAILSPSVDGALVVFGGANAPLNLRIAGAPRAITALPDGGFLVLTQLGSRAHVARVSADGQSAGSVDLDVNGRALAYDAANDRVTVAAGDTVAYAALPIVNTGVSAATSPSPTARPSANATSAPFASATATLAPSAAPSASSAPSASASASPSASPSPSPSLATRASPNPLTSAGGQTNELLRLSLPDGRLPILVSRSGERIWILDDANGIDTVEMGSEDMFAISSLPSSAQISLWKAGRAYVYALDTSSGVLYVVDQLKERWRSYDIKLLRPVTSIAVSSDDRLWMGSRDTPFLLAFEPKTGQVSSYDLGPARVSTLTVDPLGRILYADDARSTVGTFDPQNSALNEVLLRAHAPTSAFVVDGSSTLWLATTTGEIYRVRGGFGDLVLALRRPVTALALDQAGYVWYLAPLPSGASGYGFAALDGQAVVSVNGPASSLDFNALGHAWLADPRGGFYVSRDRLR